MIYLDTSVALAHLLGKDRAPPVDFWNRSLLSSKLIEYELWTRLHAYDRADSHGELARALVARVALVRLEPTVLARATEAFPLPVRTLDALHLASFDYVRSHGLTLELATYDERMREVASVLGWPLADCG